MEGEGGTLNKKSIGVKIWDGEQDAIADALKLI